LSFVGCDIPYSHETWLPNVVSYHDASFLRKPVSQHIHGEATSDGHCSLVFFERPIGWSGSSPSSSASASAPSDAKSLFTFVHVVGWHTADSRFGRVFVEDVAGNLKWNPPTMAMFKLQHFPDCTIVLGNAGVQPVKMKEARPPIPRDTLRIKQMYKAAFQSNCTGDVQAALCKFGGDPCRVCGLNKGTVDKCAVCLQAFHTDSCLRNLLQVSGNLEHVKSHVATRGSVVHVPALFSGAAMCMLCRLVACKNADDIDASLSEV
jgi:hypothetical protein